MDFYCPKGNLIIELDGGQHYSTEGRIKDGYRNMYMESLGLRVIRFSDREVFALPLFAKEGEPTEKTWA